MDRGALVIGTDESRFKLHGLNRFLFNVSTLRRRNLDGVLYSTRNSRAHSIPRLLLRWPAVVWHLKATFEYRND